jgi:phosphoribosyl-ATP pyrophosphohydrolase
MFTKWVEAQTEYQLDSYGLDLPAMDESTKLAYIDTCLKAAILEIGEAYDEFSWKPWASNTFLNRDALVGESVDVLFFIANVLAALGVSSDELTEKYRRKMGINTARQVQGYDTSTTKCPNCKRALDDEAVSCTADVCSQEG